MPEIPWLLFVAALLAGGVVKGALGVGLPLLAVPLLSLGMAPHLAIALLSVPVLASNLWQALENGRLVSGLQRFGGLMAAQFLATVLTVRMTLSLSAAQLSTLLAAAVLLTVALMVWKPALRISAARERMVGVCVGLLSGLLGGVSSLTGPIVITYLVALQLRRDEFVGSISLIYLAGALPLYGAMLLFGRLGTVEILGSLVALVPVSAGLLAGKALRQRVDDAHFRRMLQAFLVVLALLLLFK
ncbi:protein of unknown function DUF81 [Delftia sp. Cs1-4]|uniref:sulfite exporter TauE/SafE family protein n=1 Tax=Delftia sp. (strain Cs1-4) TaxID=742013 RepID=UPI00020E7BCD|nr:sulfite exporter TauE/SafE family protein [Delftia sp. Cs1-4]AEF88796.1 protein of unknown function DUF81 [Delftia sp. Cs1-4]